MLTISSHLFARWHLFRHVGYLRHQQQIDFDLLTLKVVSESRVTLATSVPILVFLGLSVFELSLMYATDRRQTLDRRRTKASLNASALWRRKHNKGRRFEVYGYFDLVTWYVAWDQSGESEAFKTRVWCQTRWRGWWCHMADVTPESKVKVARSCNRGVARGGQGGQSHPQSPLRKNKRQKQLILFTTFTLHIKLHSELHWRRNALNVLRCYKSTDLSPLVMMQLLTDLPPLQHGDLTF